MKRFAGLAVSAGLVVAASAANAQMPAPYAAGGQPSYRAVSDFDGPYERPYGAMPPAPPPVYGYGGYGPALLPPQEVYAVLRDNGFSPLGAPHQRGFVYVIAAVDRRGDDGRLVIDARNGRILRFVPAAYGYGPYGEALPAEPMSGYGPEAALPPPTVIRGGPRPPAPIPHVASRSVPLPAPKPAAAAASAPQPQRSAAIEAKPASPPPAPINAPTLTQAVPLAGSGAALPAQQAKAPPPAPNATVGEAKPAAPVIQPTQAMPQVQGLD